MLKSRQVYNTKTIPKNSILLNPKFDSKNKIENFVKQDAGLHNCFRYVFFQILMNFFFFQTSMFLVTLDFLGFKISFIWFLMAERYLDCIPSF